LGGEGGQDPAVLDRRSRSDEDQTVRVKHTHATTARHAKKTRRKIRVLVSIHYL
jgi:hypothetical protein